MDYRSLKRPSAASGWRGHQVAHAGDLGHFGAEGVRIEVQGALGRAHRQVRGQRGGAVRGAMGVTYRERQDLGLASLLPSPDRAVL